jgi:hypothetical protein
MQAEAQVVELNSTDGFDQVQESSAIRELSALELTLIGGGMANVVFT